MVQIIRFRYKLEEPEELDELEKREGLESITVLQNEVI